MSLEQLANELLLEVFDYLDCLTIFRAFYGLNYRFNQLIILQIQKFDLDFRLVPKCSFDLFCQQHLPLLKTRIVSLHLSNEINIPELPDSFRSYGHRMNQFIILKFLSISCYSINMLRRILTECHNLSYLARLHIHTTNYDSMEDHYRYLIEAIWTLPHLTHCQIDVLYSSSAWFSSMSTVSTSIQNLSTSGTSYSLTTLCNLLDHTPNLKQLEVGHVTVTDDAPLAVTFPSLRSLRLICDTSIRSIQPFFQIIPNLCDLTVHVSNIESNGSVWEQIFVDYLKNIKTFRLVMNIQFGSYHDDFYEMKVEQLFNSFRSDFWLKKRQWFIRCDTYQINTKDICLLYTLPYPFETFSYIGNSRSKSTSPHPFNLTDYSQVRTLEHVRNNPCTVINGFTFIPIRCDNIRHLKLKFPIDEHFDSIILTLNYLISLDVILYEDEDYHQLQRLLQRAPHLRQLKFCHPGKFSMASFNLFSPSIRQLDFFQTSGFRLRYFSSTECALFVDLPLAVQCEILTMDVRNRTDIVKLINAMPNLQAMNVHCQDGITCADRTIKIHDDLIEWLHKHLSSDCSYTIVRQGYTNIPLINISINRQK
ncbi:unnamed protein product [Adineta ricciae]|uniref:F-box domain-containing protein n=1 Tax=Adineta ricciae TaxID=249248 RepID=A0A813NWI2_ADIRI|nr:unnamed protein product [Adineta ricciae]CAF0792798.1 unnamed protein product [Adineta ricciae]